MASDPDAEGIAAWLQSHAGVSLPANRLPGLAKATASASAGVSAAASGLAMEDEPAGYTLALARRAETPR